jgi:phosphoglycerate dehydrogenase-like enzyme
MIWRKEMYLLIADPSAEDYKKELAQKFPDVSIHTVAKEEEIRQHVNKMEVLVTHYRISDELLKQAKNLKWIQSMSSGVNYILNRPSLRKEVIITSTRGIHGPQMSEMAFLLMLALNRRFDQVIRNQEQRIWERWPGRLLYQKKVGIFGIGVIGEEIARKCKAFGMTVFGIDIVKRKIDSVDFFFGPGELPRVAAEVDYLILVAPSTPETQKIVGSKVLSSMKPSAFLINIARGELVDEEALIQALETGKIAGAALDTLPIEPLPKDHPLWGTKNVIITPHVGGMSDIYKDQIMPIIEENLRRFLRGERRNLINYIER